jgi:hypothetical protein
VAAPGEDSSVTRGTCGVSGSCGDVGATPSAGRCAGAKSGAGRDVGAAPSAAGDTGATQGMATTTKVPATEE